MQEKKTHTREKLLKNSNDKTVLLSFTAIMSEKHKTKILIVDAMAGEQVDLKTLTIRWTKFAGR